MKTEILKILREAGDYVSGQELCGRFQVSRTAVWKVIQKLQEEGYEIEAVKNRGYRLTLVPDVVTEAELASRLKTTCMGRPFYVYEETDSTNAEAKRLAQEGAAHGTAVAANVQTGGKGRRGRTWSMEPDANIAMSLILKPNLRPENASMLTLVMALAAAQGILESTGVKAAIKWPNDLVVDGHKICGILTEMSTEIDYIHEIIVGIGINCNQTEFPEEIRETAGSLCQYAGQTVDRAAVMERILFWFEKYFAVFMETQDLSGLQEAYGAWLLNTGKEVRIVKQDRSFTGKALGIDVRGELLVELPDGTVTPVYAGEVSVRGLYGYV